MKVPMERAVGMIEESRVKMVRRDHPEDSLAGMVVRYCRMVLEDQWVVIVCVCLTDTIERLD
jgi:hypothetical protein